VSSLLALSGLVILALVHEQTGTEGFLVGLALAVLPVPLLVAVFRWLDRVAPAPWRNMIFSFAWGACAAALIAIVANSFATHWIATATADPTSANTLGATVIAPIVEESSKASAVLLIYLFRRREFAGLIDGVVIAGVTATGFAFTENVLYLGTAFGDDQRGGITGFASITVATFFVRVVMSPFAHPLFTVLSGIGFGLASVSPPHRRARRVLLPAGGLLLAAGMHALWNSSTQFGEYGFVIVYGAFMVPAFGLLTWLVVWTRQRELHTVRRELPAYVAAGWLPAHETAVLGSLRARRVAREYAAHALGGKAAARAVAEYTAFATELAFLRNRGRRGRAGDDFVAREKRMLNELWRRRGIAGPALAYAVHALPAKPWQAPAPWFPFGYGYPGPAYAYGPGAGYGYPGPAGAGWAYAGGYGHGHPPAYGYPPQGAPLPPGYGYGYGYEYGYGGHGSPAPYPAAPGTPPGQAPGHAPGRAPGHAPGDGNVPGASSPHGQGFSPGHGIGDGHTPSTTP
jgi:RsiW-degrading membrane proteinase PrsW (M82 family)